VIKSTGHNRRGERVLILGLSFQNLTRLKAGDPIIFDATPYGYSGQIMIMSMKDEATMAAMIRTDNPGVVEHKEPGAP
jgi:hypothetical protein